MASYIQSRASQEEKKEYTRLKALGLIQEQGFQEESAYGHREYARLKALGLTEEQMGQSLQDGRVRAFKKRLALAQKKEQELALTVAVAQEQEQAHAQILARAQARVREQAQARQEQARHAFLARPHIRAQHIQEQARIRQEERQNLREKRRTDDKTEQIATREKQRAQYAKERPGKLEESRRETRQMQQERANRTGEDLNEIARQAEEQHKAFMERKQERTLAQAASQAPAQVSLAAFETLMNMWRQIQEQRRLRNLTLRQSACQLDDVPMIFPVITE